MGWFYKWLPSIWIVMIFIFSSCVCEILIIFDQINQIEKNPLTLIFPHWVYIVVPILYFLFLLWIIFKIKYLIDILRFDTPKENKTMNKIKRFTINLK